MAAPITIADRVDVIPSIYVNVHALVEAGDATGPYARLSTWTDGFFPVLHRDGDVEGQIHEPLGRLGLLWLVPTLYTLERLAVEPLATWNLDQMDEIISLVQNTMWSVIFMGTTATQNTDIVAAFNAAWT